MKASELRNKSVGELQQELLSLRRAQFALRLQRATGQTVKPDCLLFLSTSSREVMSVSTENLKVSGTSRCSRVVSIGV